MCFDYYYDVLEGAWVHWDTKVEAFDKAYDGLYNNLVVPTAETTRQKYLLDMHVGARKGVLYVGTAGTSKTTIIKDYFSKLDPETSLTQSISMNSYTDSATLQTVIMSQVDKRAGRTFGPPPSKTLIYFMDDLNMPKLDKYFTQSPICLVRQIIDYAMIYDRDKLSDKIYLVDIMFAACMNPKSGSFIIDIRLSRHFTLISCLTPEKEILRTIYLQILQNHMENFDKPNLEVCPKLISATMSVFL
jgi:dynein heavy chain